MFLPIVTRFYLRLYKLSYIYAEFGICLWLTFVTDVAQVCFRCCLTHCNHNFLIGQSSVATRYIAWATPIVSIIKMWEFLYICCLGRAGIVNKKCPNVWPTFVTTFTIFFHLNWTFEFIEMRLMQTIETRQPQLEWIIECGEVNFNRIKGNTLIDYW